MDRGRERFWRNKKPDGYSIRCLILEEGGALYYAQHGAFHRYPLPPPVRLL